MRGESRSPRSDPTLLLSAISCQYNAASRSALICPGSTVLRSQDYASSLMASRVVVSNTIMSRVFARPMPLVVFDRSGCSVCSSYGGIGFHTLGFAPIARGRQAEFTLERPVERSLRLIANFRSNLGDSLRGPAQ